MKNASIGILACSLLLILTATSLAVSPIRQGPRPLKPGASGIGRQVPDLPFRGMDGAEHKLSDFAGQKAVVFAMTGTGCPLCLKYSPSLAKIESAYRDQGVAFVFINPNESEALDRARNAVNTHRFNGPYVRDGQMMLSRALGAETTTEVFVLDQARTLVYRGAVDDQYGFGYALEAPRKNFLTDALDAVLEGKTPGTQATTSPGCELFYDGETAVDATVTYHNRISRIIQTNCIDCHRDNGIAPIPLGSYEQVRDYAGMIRNVIRRGVMPPWFAAPQPAEEEAPPNSLHWSNDRSLSGTEKNDLFTWIDAGAPEGDPADAPLPKAFPDGWLIGKPDAIFEFPEPLSVRATGIVPYKYVTVETNFPKDKWVQAIEIRPGKIDVVHHVIVSIDDDEGASGGLKPWAVYAPGYSTSVYPDGYARRLPAGATLRFQMHYTPNGTATEDSTRIGLVFADKPPEHEVKMMGIANSDIRIPPGESNHLEFASFRLPSDVQILGFFPHMHLRGKAARYDLQTAKEGNLTPEGNDGDLLLAVPHYDFNWQLFYRLAEPRTLRRGDSIRFTGWFDNSEGNPANPDPNKTVSWGEQTEDEMLIGYFECVSLDGDSAERPSIVQGAARPGLLRGRGQPLRRSTLAKTLRKLDKNGDGQLTPDEVPEKNKALFHELDANGDELLTTEEAAAALRKLRSR